MCIVSLDAYPIEQPDVRIPKALGGRLCAVAAPGGRVPGEARVIPFLEPVYVLFYYLSFCRANRFRTT